MPESPIRFENYEVLTREDGSIFELGRGAMGVTYKATDTDLHCLVALKVISPGILDSAEARERFLREARAAARLRHPNIATVFRLGRTADNTDYYAMEFCDGITLDKAVAQRGPLPATEALQIAWQVTKALILAEEHKILHRDLKPSNLILTERVGEGRVVKVIDFGLATSFADGHQTLASHGSSGFVGTAHFASPEQLEEHSLDTRSDIYSLGVCLWFMLDGQPPFYGPIARVMSQTLSAEPPWERIAAHPKPLLTLLRRMLAKSREARPASAIALRTEIETCLTALNVAVPHSQFSSTAKTTLSSAVDDFSSRYPSTSQRVSRDSLGTVFRACDISRGGTAITLRVMDADLLAVPATRREIESQITAARAHPHPHLAELLDHGITPQGLCIASEWLEGFSLLDLLKQRGTLTPGEVARILTPLAEVATHAARHGLRGLNLTKEQVIVHFPGGLNESIRATVLKAPVEQWPTHTIKAGTLSLGGSETGNAHSLQTMLTMAPSPSAGGQSQAGVPALAQLACEMLGGRSGAAFTPIARLSETGNNVLREALGGGYAESADFLREFTASLGKNIAITSAKSQSAAPAAPAEKGRSFKSLPLALLLMAGAALGYYYGIYEPRERERQRRSDEADPTIATPPKIAIIQPPRSTPALERPKPPQPTPEPTPAPKPPATPTLAPTPTPVPTPALPPTDEKTEIAAMVTRHFNAEQSNRVDEWLADNYEPLVYFGSVLSTPDDARKAMLDYRKGKPLEEIIGQPAINERRTPDNRRTWLCEITARRVGADAMATENIYHYGINGPPFRITTETKKLVPRPLQQPPGDPFLKQVPGFIIAHENRERARDINSILHDYAQNVNYYGKAKTRDEIGREKMNDFEKFPNHQESISQQPVAQRIGENKYQVKYNYKFEMQKRDGKVDSGEVTVTCIIAVTGGEMQITEIANEKAR